jgi:hypothetical protein
VSGRLGLWALDGFFRGFHILMYTESGFSFYMKLNDDHEAAISMLSVD